MRPTAHVDFLRTGHFDSLDGLRCLAVLPVIWHHSTPAPPDGLLGRGPVGVQLFFGISGFLITTLLLRERSVQGSIALGQFQVRRALRLFPLYYAVLTGYLIWALTMPNDAPQRAHFLQSLPYFATYTTNWLVDFNVAHPVLFTFSWSLATEEQFYLAWAIVMRLARRWWMPLLFALCAVSLDQMAEASVVTIASPLADRMITSISTPICLGALLAHALHFPRSYRWVAPLLGHRLSAPIALALCLILLVRDGTSALALHASLVALVGAVCARNDNGLAWLFSWSPARWVGKVSYGMYMLHVTAIGAVKALFPSAMPHPLLVFVLAVALTSGFAAVSFRFFEQPISRLRRYFRPSRTCATRA